MPWYQICTIPGCSSRSDRCECEGVKFHRLPQDPDQRYRWRVSIKKPISVSENTRICSLHFESCSVGGKSIEAWRGSKNAVRSTFLQDLILIFSFTLAFLHILCLCAYIDTLNLLYVIYVCVAVILRLSLHNHSNPEHKHCNPLMSYLWY